MKTNCFDLAARAGTVTSLQIAVLPIFFVSLARATPVIGDQIPANSQPHTISNGTTRLANRASIAKASSSSCAKPRGVRVYVKGIFNVTNSDDGFRDNDVEVYGFVKFNGQTMWRVASNKAVTQRDYSAFETDGRGFDVIYNEPSTWMLRVDGFLYDYDKGSGNDAMWNPGNQTRAFNLKEMKGNSIWNGDRKSESADLTLVISRRSYIY